LRRGNNDGHGHGDFPNKARNKFPPCQLCGKTNHLVFKCYKSFDPNFMGEERSANATNSYGIDSNWYADLGATDHVIGGLDKLAVWDTYNGNDQIYTANDTGMCIKHVGQSIICTLHRNIFLNNVLHVPQASKNLASIHRIAFNNNVFFELHPNFFFIKDRESRRTLLQGKVKGGLYPLPCSTSQSSSSKQALSSNKYSITRWHACLGHPSSSIVMFVLNKNNLPSSRESLDESVCDACQQAKSHQLPYPKSICISKSPLELIFSNVWGPTCDSIGRNKYYVSFIDDFSKFTWIYLLKNKSEVFQKFKEFKALVERLFDKKILAVQTDWGGEFQKLHPFFTQIGIAHHVSCPYVHQQNGSAERKHRHIVEVGLSLLAHASMSLKYWDEAFLGATYLINRLPTKVLDFSSPLERLFHEKPNYSGLCIFGCACWPNLRPFNMHKLQFCSKQCVFLGYSNLHKGFKFLDVAGGRGYISRDVVFDETVYPFTKLNPNASTRLRSEILLLPSSSKTLDTSSSGVQIIDSSTTDVHNLSIPANASSPSTALGKNLAPLM
jgi:hypothetical protein